MKITNVAFFAYGVSDMKKARGFYEGFLGLTPNGEFDKEPDSMYVEYDIGETTLGIGSSEQWPPSEAGASAALEVDDLDALIAAVKDKGIRIASGPHEFPSCKMIVITDPDKNKVTLHQRKK